MVVENDRGSVTWAEPANSNRIDSTLCSSSNQWLNESFRIGQKHKLQGEIEASFQISSTITRQQLEQQKLISSLFSCQIKSLCCEDLAHGSDSWWTLR